MNIKKSGLFLLIAAFLMSPAGATAQVRILDAPYVPTKFPVVDEMLKMAGVQAADVLYDLGCGDGRIVIGAAQKYGARGVGIDLDPERIRESEINAAKAGVSDKVRFATGDLFETDIREATVVSLYLLTAVNLRLRPRLLRELRPGARVVSHNFGMDRWLPDVSSEVDVDGVRHDVFLWVIPANTSGAWSWTMRLDDKPVAARLHLVQKYQYATGSIRLGRDTIDVKDAKIQGDTVRFTFETTIAGNNAALAFEGKITGHTLNGTVRTAVEGEVKVRPWKASRAPGTEKPIDEPPAAD